MADSRRRDVHSPSQLVDRQRFIAPQVVDDGSVGAFRRWGYHLLSHRDSPDGAKKWPVTDRHWPPHTLLNKLYEFRQFSQVFIL